MRNVSWSMLRQPSRNSAPSCITRFGKEMQPWKRHASRRRQNLRLSAACLKPKRLVIVAIGCCEQALATNRDLQAKLDAFARGFETAKAEPAAERQARLKADDSRPEAPIATARGAALPGSHGDAVIQTIRRPVGRPRKTAATAPARASNKTDGKAKDFDEIIAETAGNLQEKARNREAAGQEPVQWWVEGWNGRGS